MMAQPKNMDEVRDWTDSQILQYLKEYWGKQNLTFEAYADQKPISTKDPQRYQGSISKLKYNGTNIKYPIIGSPIYFNIPITANINFEYGQCEIKCALADRAFREEIGNMFFLKPLLSSFKVTGKIIPQKAEERDVITLKRNLKLKDEKFIGLFTLNSKGSYIISDIRRSDFSSLILPNGKKQTAFLFSPKGNFKPIDNTYYEFGWLLDNIKPNYEYQFQVNEQEVTKKITPQTLVRKLHDDIMDYPAGAGQKIVKMLDTLKNQLTASGKEIFIYELLQNANDYPNGKDKMVDVEFYITKDYLIFQHTGAEFNERNIAAICNINDKEKTDNSEAIGYKGIGFKTVFLDNNYVYLKTGGFSFRFDQSFTRDMVDTPYQILPIWTNFEKINPEIQEIFKNSESDYRVQFALRPISHATLRKSSQNFVSLFKDVFENERIILFIPHISSVKIYHSNTLTPDIIRNKDAESWVVSTYSEEISEELRESINADIEKQEEDGTFKIPTKYYDFQKTAISFACQREKASLKEVEDANLYCYLPTKTTWGFNFLMNTDMIPTGPRDDIELDVNINAEIAEIAGRKFFLWIKDLLKSRSYKLNTIFGLIPNFEKCIREHKKYEKLITRFQQGLEDCLKTEPIIPIKAGFAKIENLILDDTKITASSVMTDEEFISFAGIKEKYLPLAMLRKDKDFNSFLKRYIKAFKFEENIFETEHLVDFCSNDEFNEWLQDQDCNNRFLAFLANKELLDDFTDEAIFLDSNKDLYIADEIYNDIDAELVDLSAFSEYLPHLSLETRKFFAGNKEWESATKDIFKKFDADDFVDDVLLSSDNIDVVTGILKDKEASLHFYKFLAERVRFTDTYKGLPFIDANNNAVDNFTDNYVYFNSPEGYKVKQALWMDKDWIDFISDEYCDSTKKYFEENFDVEEFSHKSIIDNIITYDSYTGDIQEKIREDYKINKDFVDYCYQQKDSIKIGELRNFTLYAYDKEGDGDYRLTEENIYFGSPFYNDYSGKAWLDKEQMYSLDEDYFDGLDSKETDEFKKFLGEKFGIGTFDLKNFYKEVVRPNLTKIFENISGDNDPDGSLNIDFVEYLDDNYKLIFDEEKDEDKFTSMILIDSNGYDLKYNDAAYCYLFHPELKEITDKPWFPDLVSMCSERYKSSKSLQKIGVKNYRVTTFFDEVITGELDDIIENLSDFENNKDFHSFVISHIRSLTAEQILNIKDVPVYLYGCEEPADTSYGHKTLSSKAKELFEKKLVEPEHLDIINPEYNTEQCVDYWETKLGNTKFTVNHFVDWLSENEDTFAETLEDEQSNIDYWRWVKDNVTETTLKSLPKLPVLIQNANGTEKLTETIYFSDEYLEGTGIQSIVTRYDKDALFISDAYMQQEDDIEEWKRFWNTIGVRYEIIDILINSVIPNLSALEDEKLPALFAKHRDKLSETFEDLPAALTSLRVKAYDQEYYSIDKTIYIDCEKNEPFKFISIPNVITFATADERSFILDIVKSAGSTLISTLTDWQKLKINHYLKLQEEDENSVRNIHFNFISELAELYDQDRDFLKELEKITEIKLLSKEDILEKASGLTLGTKYNPFCDFQSNGIDDLLYISNRYLDNCKAVVKKFMNRILHVHCDFEQTDIKYLSNREFSIYFWDKYLIKKDCDIRTVKELISEGKFNEAVCIPTKDSVKKPTELYSRVISAYGNKKIEDWENKFPISALPEIELADKTTLFSRLPFKQSLDFLDCLYALFSIKGQDRRSQILDWMIDAYDKTLDEKIREYREDPGALWYNSKNEEKHIGELYALEYGNKVLKEYFGSHPCIINPLYFPTGDRYQEACKILQVDIIKTEDMSIDPIGENDENDVIKPFLNLCALIIAGIESADDWETRYEHYIEKISKINLWCCKSIALNYKLNSEISQKLKKFYHASPDDNDFYYVNCWTHNLVFTHFIDEFIKYTGITIEKDLMGEILTNEQTAISIVKEYNQLMIDEAFVELLDLYIPDIKRELSGNQFEEDDDDDNTYTPATFTAAIDNENESDDNNKDNSAKEDESQSFYHGNKSEKESDAEPEDDDELVKKQPWSSQGNKSSGRSTGSSNSPRTHHNGAYTDKPRQYNNSRRSNRSNNGGFSEPRPFTKKDVANFRSRGVSRTLEVLPATQSEIDELNRILGGDLSPEAVADQNYLAQLRLYKNLKKEGYTPEESEEEFVKNGNNRSEHQLTSGKYIHKCSAMGGIMYLSPSIWNKVSDERCVVCVYHGPRANEFMYFNSTQEILDWIHEDDIVIKLTGKEKADVVNNLYSGILEGVTGTAYTLIRIHSNEKYNSVFAPLNDINQASEDNIDEL